MKLILKACNDGLLFLDLPAGDISSVLRQAVDQLVDRGVLSHEDAPRAVEALLLRESQSSTAIGHAVAVPHAYLDCFLEPSIVIMRLSHGLNLGAPDGIPTRFVFVLVGPVSATSEHLDALASIARIMSDNEFRYEAQAARRPMDFRRAVERFQKRTQPAEREALRADDALAYTGQFAGGLLADLRRRLPWYVRDWRDGLASKCLAATIFLFFACLAPAITFGGIMDLKTDGQIGVVEMIIASAVCGMIYAILAGQPLIILGGTGPMLIFTLILYNQCQDWNIPFLATRAWVGIWTAGILLILAVTDASHLMRYFTRFTDEIFAALISLIFIFEAVKELIHLFQKQEDSLRHDTALLSLLLALGTFYIASSLSSLRQSRYLIPQAREFLADFGPTIAIASMACVAVWMHEVTLDTLQAPDHIQPSIDRAWLVNPWDAPVWVRWASLVPALLVSVLAFLDQNITGRLVNSRDNRLQRGPAYHLDLAVVALLFAGCSLFGLPWLVAATVRSLNHVRSLAVFEGAVSEGKPHTQILHVRETRLTGFAIHALLGGTLLFLPYVKLIPMAVLFGLFLYMGVVSMAGNQFFERMRLWLTDPALYPSTHYIRRVRITRVHLFTFIQFACLSVLWAVKVSVFGILFPLFIALLVPIRIAIGKQWFQRDELEALDAEEEPEEEELQWA